MKCTFKDCTAEGEPNQGFDFYASDACLDELGKLIAEKYKQKHGQASRGGETRIAGNCLCGRSVIKVLNAKYPTFSDGIRYAYPESIDIDRWGIFRCESCHEPIENSFVAEVVA